MEKTNSIFSEINDILGRLTEFENRLDKIEDSFEEALHAIRCNMVRVKNGENLSDDFIANSRTYNDLSPERAFEYYNESDNDFILLDVSSKKYVPAVEIAESTKIPLDELAIRHTELKNKLVPYLVISEDGVNSIIACEILYKLGFKNINNISGGYKFWPSIRNKTSFRDNSFKNVA